MSHDSHHAPVACKTELAPERSDLGLYRPDRATGWTDWLTTVDHKKIGILYGAFAMLYFLIGGVEALAIRTQLARPDNDFVTARMYNQLFTMHGTTMIFLGVMPLSAAFFNFLVPLQVGARDVAFPRLNAFSLWTFVFGAFVLNASWLFEFGHLAGWFDSFAWHKALVYTDFAPANGWFSYAPLSGTFGANGQALRFTGVGTDFWIIGIQVLGIASLAASFNFICTIINMRAKGMTMMRLPVFTWMALVTSVLIILAFPPPRRAPLATIATPSSTAIPHPPSPTSPPHPPSPHTPLAPCRPPARHRTRPSRSPAATHRYALTALTLCLPSDTGRDAHPCRCASVCRAERSSMPTPGESR